MYWSATVHDAELAHTIAWQQGLSSLGRGFTRRGDKRASGQSEWVLHWTYPRLMRQLNTCIKQQLRHSEYLARLHAASSTCALVRNAQTIRLPRGPRIRGQGVATDFFGGAAAKPPCLSFSVPSPSSILDRVVVAQLFAHLLLLCLQTSYPRASAFLALAWG